MLGAGGKRRETLSQPSSLLPLFFFLHCRQLMDKMSALMDSTCGFEVKVYTSPGPKCGTFNSLWLNLIGSEGETLPAFTNEHLVPGSVCVLFDNDTLVFCLDQLYLKFLLNGTKFISRSTVYNFEDSPVVRETPLTVTYTQHALSGRLHLIPGYLENWSERWMLTRSTTLALSMYFYT